MLYFDHGSNHFGHKLIESLFAGPSTENYKLYQRRVCFLLSTEITQRLQQPNQYPIATIHYIQKKKHVYIYKKKVVFSKIKFI